MKSCTYCQKPLTGRQTKFCSMKCKNDEFSHSGRRVVYQKNLALTRKSKIIQLKGGCCQHCGFKEHIVALSFHHKNPKIKKFNLDGRGLAGKTWKSILLELEKCDLLCLNCHAILHAKENDTYSVAPQGLEP